MFMDLQAQQLADAFLATGHLPMRHHQHEVVHYDPYQTPPDYNLAQSHGKSKRVYKMQDHKDFSVLKREVCPCCGLPEPGEQIPVCDPLSELYHLGSGWAMYFQLLKYCIALLVIVFVITGFYNIVSSGVEDDCSANSDDATAGVKNNNCVQDFVLMFTIANKKDDPALLRGQMVLNLIAVAVMGIFFQWMRYKLRHMHIDADDLTVTPGDYTIIITGDGMTSELTDQEIKQWIEDIATEEHPIKIVKINRTYDVAQYVDLKNKKDVLETLRRQVFNFEKKHSVEVEAKQVESELEQLKEGGLKPTDTVLVTFEYAAQAAYVLEEYSKVRFDSWTDYITAWFGTTSENFRGKDVYIERAPEPTDVLWENLAFPSWDRFKRRSITKIYAFLLIVVSAGLIILINWGQGEALKKLGPESHIVTAFSSVASILIVVINTILGMVTRILTLKEKHPTHTAHFTAIAEKLCVAQFLNTAWTTILAQIILYNTFNETGSFIDGLLSVPFYGKGGIVQNMFSVFISNAFLTPVMGLFDPMYFLKLYKRRQALKKGGDTTMTQQQAHALFEEPEMDLAVKNALLVKTMLMTAFFAPAIPFALIFAILGLILCYWVDKYLLLRRNVLPIALQNELCINMIENIEWMGLMFGLGNMLFVLGLQNSEGESAYDVIPKAVAFATLGLGFLLAMIPSEALNDKFLPIVDEVTEFNTYDEVRLEFTTEYAIQNPVTANEALEEHSQFLESKKHVPRVKKNNVKKALLQKAKEQKEQKQPEQQSTDLYSSYLDSNDNKPLLNNSTSKPKWNFPGFGGWGSRKQTSDGLDNSFNSQSQL